MIYLASPYTHEDPAVMQQRFEVVRDQTAEMLCAGMVVYSPIVHCHPLAEARALPRDFDFWKLYNFGMLRHASKFIILKLPGWEESKGVQAEWAMAEELGITIHKMDMDGWLR